MARNKNCLFYDFFPRNYILRHLLQSDTVGIKIIQFPKSISLLREEINTFLLMWHMTPVDPKLWCSRPPENVGPWEGRKLKISNSKGMSYFRFGFHEKSCVKLRRHMAYLAHLFLPLLSCKNTRLHMGKWGPRIIWVIFIEFFGVYAQLEMFVSKLNSRPFSKKRLDGFSGAPALETKADISVSSSRQFLKSYKY